MKPREVFNRLGNAVVAGGPFGHGYSSGLASFSGSGPQHSSL
jgi:hypothetical protein